MMAKAKSQTIQYSQLSQELSDITTKLEQGDLDIDAAVAAYDRGLQIIKNLEDYLLQTENRVQLLRDAALETGE